MSELNNDSTILIVDDNPDNLQILGTILWNNGYEVCVAANGPDALDIAQKTPPDLVVLDVRMPVMNGFETCRRLKASANLRNIPVLFLSGLTEPEDKVEGFRCGGIDYITKPFRTAEVLARIDTHLKLRRYEKRLEQAAETSEEKYRKLLESTKDIVYSVDARGRLTYLGQQATRYGIDPQDAISRLLLEFVTPEDRERVEAEFDRTVATGGESHTEFRLVAGDGRLHWFEERGGVLRDETGGVTGISGVLRDIADRKRTEQELEGAFEQIKSLKERIEAENVYLRKEIQLAHQHGDIVVQSNTMMSVLAQAEEVARTDSTVLILGETGTGKELLARAVHDLSPRSNHPLVIVNCAAIPSSLIESELFGREKGAFTGAFTKQIGRFEVADKGTILLDEIGELPAETQVKLLGVLQTNRFERLGSSETIDVDVRVLAATNRDLEKDVERGQFRRDLFYRLNVFPITIPPLRERKDDINPLVWAFVNEFSDKMGKRIESISQKSMDDLHNFHWPGNIRELRNIIERAMIGADSPVLRIQLPASQKTPPDSRKQTMAEVERQYIIDILAQTEWRIRGRGGAAETLGLKPTTLESRMKKLGISRPL